MNVFKKFKIFVLQLRFTKKFSSSSRHSYHALCTVADLNENIRDLYSRFCHTLIGILSVPVLELKKQQQKLDFLKLLDKQIPVVKHL